MRKHRRKLSTCHNSWEVADLVARTIRKLPEYADCAVEGFGPFGLTAESHVSVKRDGGGYIGSLTIRANSDDTFNYVDYNAPWVCKCKPGSIADLNGLQYAEKPLPENMNEIIELVFNTFKEVSFND